MFWVLGVLAGGLVATVAALVTFLFVWRKDTQAHTMLVEDKLATDSHCNQLEQDNHELRKQLQQAKDALRDEVARSFSRDTQTATDGKPSDVVDTLRLRLREPLETTARVDHATTTEVRASGATEAVADRPKIERR